MGLRQSSQGFEGLAINYFVILKMLLIPNVVPILSVKICLLAGILKKNNKLYFHKGNSSLNWKYRHCPSCFYLKCFILCQTCTVCPHTNQFSNSPYTSWVSYTFPEGDSDPGVSGLSPGRLSSGYSHSAQLSSDCSLPSLPRIWSFAKMSQRTQEKSSRSITSLW